MSNVTLCRSKFCFPSTNVPFLFLRCGTCDAFLKSQGIAVKLLNGSWHRTDLGFISMNRDLFNGLRQSYVGQSWTSKARTLGIHDDVIRSRHEGRFDFGLLPAVITMSLAVLCGDLMANFIRISKKKIWPIHLFKPIASVAILWSASLLSGKFCRPSRVNPVNIRIRASGWYQDKVKVAKEGHIANPWIILE